MREEEKTYFRYNENIIEKYDFGLSGYWYTANYGAALTGYALNAYIRELGYSVLMIDLPEFQFVGKNEYRDENSPTRRFIRKNCSVSKMYKTEMELNELNDLCHDFILGSDQMWNWRKNRYRDEGAFYLFDYVTRNKRIIAYSTSFGVDTFDGTNEDKRVFGYLLQRFFRVSVREKEGVEIARNLFGVDATVVVDPVFLLKKEDYITHIQYAKIDTLELPEKFIFLYLLQPTEDKLYYARRTAEQLGLNIVAVSDLDPDYIKYDGCVEWDMNYFDKIEVEDWLYLMNKAEYVVTDSYHGLCLSLIFHKHFTALNPRGGLSRFFTVADIDEIAERICIDINENKAYKLLTKQIDYKKIDEHLKAKIEASKAWFNNALIDSQRGYEDSDIYDIARFMMQLFQQDLESKVKLMEDTINTELHSIKKQVIMCRYHIVKLFLEKILRKRSVAIRCAGVHTKELLKLISNLEVVKCIWDKNVSDKEIYGYPCIKTEKSLKEYQIDTILISSYRYRHEIKNELKDISKEYEIIDLYEELENAGIVFESEFYWF